MQPLERSLLEAWPFDSWKETRLLLAVSGGADSVALLRAMRNLAARTELLHVAHFNHGWRGAESDQDEQFVRYLCEQLELPFVTERADGNVVRSEQAARDARYAFLTKAAYAAGARYVVTAHTASDRVETMLHNLCRGTGLSGVAAPTQFRDLHDDLVLARPLLRCTRSQVVEYLRAIDQIYRDDASNANETFKRNFIRHRVLPLLQQTYGEQVDNHLLNFSLLAEDAVAALRFYALRWLDDCLVGTEGKATAELLLPVGSFRAAPWPVVQAALEICWKRNQWPLQAMTREHWNQIREVALAEVTSSEWKAKLNLPGNLQLAAKQGFVRIARCNA